MAEYEMNCNNCARSFAQYELRRGLCLECTSALLDVAVELSALSDRGGGNVYPEDTVTDILEAVNKSRRDKLPCQHTTATTP